METEQSQKEETGWGKTRFGREKRMWLTEKEKSRVNSFTFNPCLKLDQDLEVQITAGSTECFTENHRAI